MIGRISITRRASLALGCEPGVAYDVLSDYATYIDWLPGIKSSSVLARETNFAVTEIEYSAWPAHKFTLECIHAPTQMVIARSLLGHPQKIRLEWKITSPSPGESLVTLTVSCPVYFPLLLGGYGTFLSPARMLKALKAQAATFGSSLPAGDVLIEITDGEEGLMCTYKGKKYKMEAAN